MSGVNLPGTRIRKGSVDAIARFLEEQGTQLPQKVREHVEEVARQGGTPLVVAENSSALGVIHLKDIVKGGLKDRLARLRAMGIRTIMITGDNRSPPPSSLAKQVSTISSPKPSPKTRWTSSSENRPRASSWP